MIALPPMLSAALLLRLLRLLLLLLSVQGVVKSSFFGDSSITTQFLQEQLFAQTTIEAESQTHKQSLLRCCRRLSATAAVTCRSLTHSLPLDSTALLVSLSPLCQSKSH